MAAATNGRYFHEGKIDVKEASVTNLLRNNNLIKLTYFTEKCFQNQLEIVRTERRKSYLARAFSQNE